MKQLFYTFYISLRHPFKMHDYFFQKRQGQDVPWDGPISPRELSFTEAMAPAWLLLIIQTFYILLLFNFQNFLDFFGVDVSEWTQSDSIEAQKQLVIFSLFKIVFFPLWIWAYFKLWSFCINLFLNLFPVSEDELKQVPTVLYHSLAAYMWLLIPFIGSALEPLFFLGLVFIGIHKNIRLGKLQSLFVILSPLIILGIVLGLMVYLTVMFISNFT